MARSTRGAASSLGLALLYLTVQRVTVLAQFRGLVLPILWYAPLLDRLLLVRGVALLGSGDNGGVDDLSTHSKIAQRSQRLVEAKKQSVDDFGLLQGFPEGPDCIGVG